MLRYIKNQANPGRQYQKGPMLSLFCDTRQLAAQRIAMASDVDGSLPPSCGILISKVSRTSVHPFTYPFDSLLGLLDQSKTSRKRRHESNRCIFPPVDRFESKS